MSNDNKYQQVIAANIALHSRMSSEYSTCEPHFRPENIRNVERRLAELTRATNARRLLDLGCGTGFMINIAKSHVAQIDGVDVTRAMLDQVDLTGDCLIRLFEADAGAFSPDEGAYEVVTSYSFLHHLYDIVPTLKTAHRALRTGGKFYADLDPNYYFWEGINQLDRDSVYDHIVKREIEAVTYKDEDIEKSFGVPKEIFNNAEYGKNILGGFKEEWLVAALREIGFSQVEVFYHWFIGQGTLINDAQYAMEARFQYADVMSEMLQRALPISRNLFKYIGFVATK